MPTVLITGVNRGLGLEFVKHYAAQGWRVIGTCRNPDTAGEVQQLAQQNANIEVHALDVTDAAAVMTLAGTLSGTAIDLLIANAGVLGDDCASFGTLEEAALMRVMHVNTIAPLILIQAFADHVAASDKKLIIAMGSILGSIAENTDGGLYSYRASKAALHALMKSVAADLAPRGIIAIPMHPGWVITDMGGANAQITTQESITGMAKVIAGLSPEDAGRLLTYNGTELRW